MTERRHIESPANPLVKSVAKLRTRKGREQAGAILIDGWREVTRARAGGVHLEQLFLPRGSELAARAEGALADTVIELAPAAFEKIAFGNRAECVATARTPKAGLDSLSLADAPLVVVVEGLEKPGNLGAIARSADAVGASALVAVDPVTDVFNPNAIRASLGTLFTLPVVSTTFSAYKAWAEELALTHLLARCEEAVRYTSADYRGPTALVLGAEASGLTGRWDTLSAQRSVMIPMLGAADSLNVSIAAAVLLYEALRQRTSESP